MSSRATKHQILLVASPVNIPGASSSPSSAQDSVSKWHKAGELAFGPSLPSLLDASSFRMHIAVVLIQESIWLDRQQTLLARFRQGRFFEHQGTFGISKADSEGHEWKEKDIMTILAIEQVGWTTATLEDVGNLCRFILRNRWPENDTVYYHPLWWNCHDVAIFLTHLIDESAVSARKLPKLYIHLSRLRQKLLKDGRRILRSYTPKDELASALGHGFSEMAGGGMGLAILLANVIKNVNIWEPISNGIATSKRQFIIEFLQERDARLKQIDAWENLWEDNDYENYFDSFRQWASEVD